MDLNRLLFSNTLSGGARWVPTILRWFAGIVLVAVSLSKFTRHQDLVDAFIRYGIPLPEASVYLAGTIELFGGILLLLGLLSRAAALALVGNMTVAVLTGGRIDPDFQHLGLGLMLLVSVLVILIVGPGNMAIDNRWAPATTVEPSDGED